LARSTNNNIELRNGPDATLAIQVIVPLMARPITLCHCVTVTLDDDYYSPNRSIATL